MLKSTFADAIAVEMDRILRDNASNAAIEKVAAEMPIKKVSDDQPSEIEKELETAVSEATKPLDKTASDQKDCGPCKGYYVKDKTAEACTCDCKSMGECKNGCSCHSSPPKPSVDWAKVKAEAINTLLKASEELDSLGLSKYATLAVVMAAKVSKKTKTKKDSKKDKEAPKSKSKKTTEKAKSKKSDKAKKDSKKSSK